MCNPVRCKSCGKTTWSGCGQHIDQVKAVVPVEEWCDGHPDTGGGGWLRRILGR